MLSHGADPEQLGAWPASRAILTAAFAGELAYVKALRQAGVVIAFRKRGGTQQAEGITVEAD